jgi:hypothetical protein
LADYPWSSYPAYAYNKKHPEWLKTDIILKQSNARDKQIVIRTLFCPEKPASLGLVEAYGSAKIN